MNASLPAEVQVSYPTDGYQLGVLQSPAARLVDRHADAAALTSAATRLRALIHERGITPQLVAFDIDGTLLWDNQISTAIATGLRELAATDMHVVIATGRSVTELLPVIQTLQIPDLWVVCSNGAVILHARTTAQAGETSPIEYRLHRLVTFQPAGPALALQAALPQTIFATELIGAGFRVSKEFPPGEIIGNQIVMPFAQVVAQPTTKLVARLPQMERDEFEEAVAQIGLSDVEWCVGWGAWLDAAPPGTSKATGLVALCAELGVSADSVITVGDSTNDIHMFEWSALAVGIGSGHPRALAVTDIVVPGIHEDGSAAVIQALNAEVATSAKSAGKEKYD